MKCLCINTKRHVIREPSGEEIAYRQEHYLSFYNCHQNQSTKKKWQAKFLGVPKINTKIK